MPRRLAARCPPWSSAPRTPERLAAWGSTYSGFTYTNSADRPNYYVGDEIVTGSHLDRTMHLPGHIPGDNRLHPGDKEPNVVSF